MIRKQKASTEKKKVMFKVKLTVDASSSF